TAGTALRTSSPSTPTRCRPTSSTSAPTAGPSGTSSTSPRVAGQKSGGRGSPGGQVAPTADLRPPTFDLPTMPDFLSDPLWYKDAVIYELHVRSFFDANDDGFGDFAGLRRKLPYLERLGVNTLW